MFPQLSTPFAFFVMAAAAIGIRVAMALVRKYHTPSGFRTVKPVTAPARDTVQSTAHVRVLVAHANGGDSKAQVELALRYLHGNGVPKNENIADHWFQKAAQKGNPKGLLYLAYLSESEGNFQAAGDYLLRAAERENSEAMERLGRLYMEGDATINDPQRGCHFYREAALAGRRSAQRVYAQCLLLGKGCERDVAGGTVEMKLAAEQGDKGAQAILDLGIERFIKDGGQNFSMEDSLQEPASDTVPDGPSRKPVEDRVIVQNPFFAIADDTKGEGQGGLQFLEMPPTVPERKTPLIPASQVMSLDDAMGQLERLIGLDEAKAALLGLTNRMRLHKLREEHKLPIAPVVAHMVFSGNPGTGKTTVARLIGNIFREIGILKKGHMIEVSRADLIGEYVGQTAPLVQRKVAEAIDGVLFIDEAYALMDGGDSKSSFGSEAIATLLKLMEDNRHCLVVIMAGYGDRMDELIRSNPGLSSRFSRVINFEDFNAFELFQIFEGFVEDFGYTLDLDAAEELSVVIQLEDAEKDVYFGNARTMRQLFDETLNVMANRIALLKKPQKSDLVGIIRDDIALAYGNIKD
ncbi:MAG: putative sporulation protein [Micavibrio sp.]|nr:putative sporulation protein [Micavibrio sp.]